MDTENTFSPPYNVPWTTFYNTIEKVAADVPNKVDRSYLGSASGGLKSYLISAFKNFGLIDDDHNVGPDLKEMAQHPEKRPEMIANLLRLHYPLAVKLGTSNSTPGELEEAFAEMFPTVTGESRTKAIRWFLAAAEFAGIERSSLWKAPKSARAPRRKRTKAASNNNKETEAKATPTNQNLRQFTLPSGRTLTISIDGDAFTLPREERTFVMSILDQIEDEFDESTAETTTTPEGDDTEDSE